MKKSSSVEILTAPYPSANIANNIRESTQALVSLGLRVCSIEKHLREEHTCVGKQVRQRRTNL